MYNVAAGSAYKKGVFILEELGANLLAEAPNGRNFAEAKKAKQWEIEIARAAEALKRHMAAS